MKKGKIKGVEKSINLKDFHQLRLSKKIIEDDSLHRLDASSVWLKYFQLIFFAALLILDFVPLFCHALRLSLMLKNAGTKNEIHFDSSSN